MAQPTLVTSRLVLRPLAPDDLDDLVRLAGEKAIASTTTNIPHPYDAQMGAEWMASTREGFERGDNLVFAIALRDDGAFAGSIGLRPDPGGLVAELGYWVGVPYWGRGYATEAAAEMLRYGFEDRKLTRVHAHHFARNPASGRVMRKIGMTREGYLRSHVLKWGVLEDVVVWGVLDGEWRERRV